MFHLLQNVKPLPNFVLEATFQNGERRLYDVSKVFDKWEPFQAFLLTKGLFAQVKMERGGYAAVWNDNLDLACDELYYNGAAV